MESIDNIYFDMTDNSYIPAPLVVFGEVLYDCFPDGRRVLGGAPFNVAWSLRGFGQDPVLLSAVGDDDDGLEIRQSLMDWGLKQEGVATHPDLATGTVDIELEDGEPSYTLNIPRAWDAIPESHVQAAELLYHGSLALRDTRSRSTFELLASTSPAKRFFDVNLRPPYDDLDLVRFWLRGAAWVKLNLDELRELLNQPEIQLVTAADPVTKLRQEYGIETILLTAGKDGAMIQGEYGEALQTPAPTPDPFLDAVGAGDALAAATLHGVLSGQPADRILGQAMTFASKVCGLRGATTTETSFYTL